MKNPKQKTIYIIKSWMIHLHIARAVKIIPFEKYQFA